MSPEEHDAWIESMMQKELESVTLEELEAAEAIMDAMKAEEMAILKNINSQLQGPPE